MKKPIFGTIVLMSGYYTQRTSSYTSPSFSPSPLLQAILAIGCGLVLFSGMIAATLIGYDVTHADKIYPGVSVRSVDLSGLTPPEAAALLGMRIDYPNRGRIAFQEGTSTWVAKPSELGLFMDSQGSAVEAYNMGRHGNPLTRLAAQFQAWSTGVDLAPMLVFDERIARSYLLNIAAQVDRPMIEATLAVEGVDVVVKPGQVGRTMDVDAALKSLEAQLQSLSDGMIVLKVNE
ncbi:MAG: hypothetical protein EHM70_20695, partial [Chloroflexota bacterium]